MEGVGDCGLDSTGSRGGAGCCQQNVHETWGFMKGTEFLDQLSHCRLLTDCGTRMWLVAAVEMISYNLPFTTAISL
jgi:hypothetical protein